MNSRLKIGMIDSGIIQAEQHKITDSAAFIIQNKQLIQAPAQTDQLGHGTVLWRIIHQAAPAANYYIAQVFQQRLSTTPHQVAAAIEWLIFQKVQLINLSLGLATPSPILAELCQQAQAEGIFLIATNPSCGAPVYPAAYPNMIRVTGDARCQKGEIAYLNTSHAEFGAHVYSDKENIRGASVAGAYVTAHFAKQWQSEISHKTWLAHARENVNYKGVEKVEERKREEGRRS